MPAYDPANPQGGGTSPFNSARNQVTQQAQGQQQDQSDAMNRRLASMGMQNSGAALTGQADIDRNTAQNEQNAQGNINLQEEQQQIPFELQGQQEAFQGQEQNQQLAQQQGQFTQAQGQQASQFGQNLGLQQQAQSNQVSQFAQELPLQQQSLSLETQAQAFNEQLANYQEGHSGGLLGSGGYLGTGLGAGGSLF